MEYVQESTFILKWNFVELLNSWYTIWKRFVLLLEPHNVDIPATARKGYAHMKQREGRKEDRKLLRVPILWNNVTSRKPKLMFIILRKISFVFWFIYLQNRLEDFCTCEGFLLYFGSLICSLKSISWMLAFHMFRRVRGETNKQTKTPNLEGSRFKFHVN